MSVFIFASVHFYCAFFFLVVLCLRSCFEATVFGRGREIALEGIGRASAVDKLDEKLPFYDDERACVGLTKLKGFREFPLAIRLEWRKNLNLIYSSSPRMVS